jgi:hypothetical protein
MVFDEALGRKIISDLLDDIIPKIRAAVDDLSCDWLKQALKNDGERSKPEKILQSKSLAINNILSSLVGSVWLRFVEDMLSQKGPGEMGVPSKVKNQLLAKLLRHGLIEILHRCNEELLKGGVPPFDVDYLSKVKV